MEILKKTAVFFMLIGLQSGYAQDQKMLLDAFTKSYTLETTFKYSEAIEALKSLNTTDNYPVALRLGWLSNLAKKYDESAGYYRKASELMPVSVEALLGLVNPLANQKKWTEVEQVYLDILKIEPKNSTVNFRLGQIYYNRKEYSKAEKYFSTALNLYPFDYDSMLMSAWNYYFLGNYNEAKALFNRVLLYSPKDASAKEGLGMIK